MLLARQHNTQKLQGFVHKRTSQPQQHMSRHTHNNTTTTTFCMLNRRKWDETVVRNYNVEVACAAVERDLKRLRRELGDKGEATNPAAQ